MNGFVDTFAQQKQARSRGNQSYLAILQDALARQQQMKMQAEERKRQELLRSQQDKTNFLQMLAGIQFRDATPASQQTFMSGGAADPSTLMARPEEPKPPREPVYGDPNWEPYMKTKERIGHMYDRAPQPTQPDLSILKALAEGNPSYVPQEQFNTWQNQIIGLNRFLNAAEGDSVDFGGENVPIAPYQAKSDSLSGLIRSGSQGNARLLSGLYAGTPKGQNLPQPQADPTDPNSDLQLFESKAIDQQELERRLRAHYEAGRITMEEYNSIMGY